MRTGMLLALLLKPWTLECSWAFMKVSDGDISWVWTRIRSQELLYQPKIKCGFFILEPASHVCFVRMFVITNKTRCNLGNDRPKCMTFLTVTCKNIWRSNSQDQSMWKRCLTALYCFWANPLKQTDSDKVSADSKHMTPRASTKRRDEWFKVDRIAKRFQILQLSKIVPRNFDWPFCKLYALNILSKVLKIVLTVSCERFIHKYLHEPDTSSLFPRIPRIFY